MEVLTEEEAVRSARAAFGHLEGITDMGCLRLRISQLSRLSRERLVASEEASFRARKFELELQRLRRILSDDYPSE